MDSLEPTQAKHLTAETMERQVLGLLMSYPEQGKLLGLPLLKLADFFVTPNRLIYQAIVAITETGAVPEYIAVTEILRQTHQLEGVGLSYVANLIARCGSVVNLEPYCRVLNQHRAKRELLNHAQGIYRAIERGEDVFDVLAAGEKAFTDISQSFAQTTMHTLESSAMEGVKMLVDRLNNPTQARVQLGLSVLDNAVGGLEPGDVIVYAARSGIGKTDFLVQFARHNGLIQQIPGVIFSLEMTRMQMAFRFTAYPSGIPASITREAVTRDQIWHIANTVETKMQGANHIVLNDTPGASMAAIRATLMQAKAKHPNLGWAVIDYIQLIKGKKGADAVEATTEASIALKALAKELSIVIVELGQLGREVDKRPLPVPLVSDLRASAQIEMDADMIILPWRPSYYGKDCNSHGDPIPEHEVEQYVEFIIGKNRHKSPSIAVGRYHAGESRFSCWDSLGPTPMPMLTVEDKDLPF